MINILFIHQSADLYGSDKTLLQLLSKINRAKYNPVVVIPLDGPLKTELEKHHVTVIISPVLKLYRKIFTPKNILNFFKQFKESVSALDELHKVYNFQIVYSNTLAVLLGMIYAKKRKLKHIWHVHEIIVHPKLIAYIFPKLLKRNADVIVCNSKATLENLLKREPKLEQKSLVIHNGLNPRNHKNTMALKSDFGFTDSDFVVTLIGRINRLKGHKWLLSSYLNYFDKNTSVKLLFVGSPVVGQEYYLEEVKQIISDNSLNEKVRILDFTKELQAVFQITDLVVVPSTEAESFGLVALEAMLEKKAVIGSNHGGLKEIIVPNQTGFLIEPNKEEELASAIKRLYENEKLRIAFGQKGYEIALKEFSEENYIQRFESLFESLSKT